MEERKTSNQTRNSSNNNAVVSKKAGVVRKNINKSVSPKRASSMHAVKKVKVETKRKEDRQPFPWSIVVVATLFTALFLFMMMNYAEIDQYNGEIRDLQNTLAKLQNEQKKLEVRLENKDDRAAFEQYAIEELGMVKADTLDKYIVTLAPEDKTEIMEYEDEQESGFGYLLSGLAEVMRGFFGE